MNAPAGIAGDGRRARTARGPSAAAAFIASRLPGRGSTLIVRRFQANPALATAASNAGAVREGDCADRAGASNVPGNASHEDAREYRWLYA
jgi:hypothetical protein